MSVFFVTCTICTLSQYRPGVDCQFIGQTVWLRSIGDVEWERFVVADCAKPPGTDGSYEWMTGNLIVGEVDYDTAERWDRVGIAALAQVKTYQSARMPILER